MDHMTAKMSSFVRAYHHKNSKSYVFDDNVAELILGHDYELIASSLIGGIRFFLPGIQGTSEEGLRKIIDSQLAPSVLGRSSYCERMLQNEYEKGCRQYLLFASGYDTFSIRNARENLRVFELDIPEVLEDKKIRIKNAALESDAIYVPCDLAEVSWMDKIVSNGFDSKIKSFGSLLGITYYLEKDEFGKLLSRISELIPKGSAICFDYQTLDESLSTKINEKLADGAGESMKAAYSFSELEKLVANSGFLICEHLDDCAMTKQYFEEYNKNNPMHIMQAPKGVNYIFAIKA